MAMISHMGDILEALLDSILQRLAGMPFMLRYFFKVVYQECMAKYRDEHGELKILSIVSEFLISKWISIICSTDIALHGLSKDFYLE